LFRSKPNLILILCRYNGALATVGSSAGFAIGAPNAAGMLG
jgi:hypothetical protein